MRAPTGTVTFLFTDIEASTRLWEAAPEAMRTSLARHDAIVREAIEGHRGYVFSTAGDGFAAAFARPGDAAAAALGAQDALSAQPWPAPAPIRVRMGLHTGVAEERDGDYFGTSVNRAARLMALGHGGQVLCSSATAELLDGVDLVDLGEHRLRDLSARQRVFQAGPGRFPPLRSLDTFPGNLPLQVSSFIGREREVERTVAALHDARVVTLTGVGGVGKTRLALQVAADVLPRFREGAWLVELAPVRDRAAVAGALAAVFDASPRAGQTVQEALTEFLRAKELLLVLDNCEHVLGAVAALVGSLQRSCPHLAVLATSREGLGIEGEQLFTVPSLAAPDEGAGLDAVASSDAARLFVERARAVKAEFALTPANASAVSQVCRRLDGVPLAIELAAARVPAMNPSELAQRLDRRFEVLAGGRRGAVERHQTLRATIDWSYELLDEPQRRLLARLSVFAGGCTMHAAEAVCAGRPVDGRDVLEMMAALVAQSLVVAEDNGLDTRYRLLETIRQYGEERLDEHAETSELRCRHAQYYADLAAYLFEQFFTPNQVETATRLAVEQENVVRALNWAVDTSNADVALRLLCSVPFAAAQLGFGFSLPSEPVLALPDAREHPEYPIALANAAGKAAFRGERRAAERWCEEALAAEDRLGTHPDGRVDQFVASVRGGLAMSAGAWDDAANFYERAAAMASSAGRSSMAVSHLSYAAQCHAVSGDSGAAVPLAIEGLALARESGVPTALTMGLNALAIALADRDPKRAKMLLQESLEIGAQKFENAGLLSQATLVAARLGDQHLALELAARVIPRLHWSDERPQLAGIFNVVAWAGATGDPDGAAVLQGAARRLALSAMDGRDQALNGPVGSAAAGSAPPATAGLITELRRHATGQLGELLGRERLRELRNDGEAMDTHSAVQFALALIDRVLGGP